jgi:spore germination cell wall hydrolase CwlJ-like protein
LKGLLSKLLIVTCLALPTSTLGGAEIKALFDLKEFKCLVKNVYFESRGEPVKGQEAVALVTLNRVKSPHYPDSVCRVVYAKSQFSWTTKVNPKVKDQKAWKTAEDVVYRVLSGNSKLKSFKATHFHATYVSPNWGMKPIAKIGNHIFY